MKNIMLAAALLFTVAGYSQYGSQWQVDSLEEHGSVVSTAEVVSKILKSAQK